MKVYVNPEPCEWDALLERPRMAESVIGERVAGIIAAVRMGGDEALIDYAEKLDGAKLKSLLVTDDKFAEAEKAVPDELKKAIWTAGDNIEKFHAAQFPAEVDVETMPGVKCIQRPVAIEKVGLYIPGGSAPLFSTVLMLAIPARIAGCLEIVLCTPPDREGKVAPAILYAAKLCGVNKVVKAGGAQAIAAMAYGTRSVPKVHKIFGPGNQYVTVAKQQVSNMVAIDMPAGPSEVMVMADETANHAFVAADLLSQAEHGADSQVILLASSRSLVEKVMKEIEVQLSRLSRAETARRALDNSRAVVMDSDDDMVAFANAYAAEHLIISMKNPWDFANRITAAGSVFLGNYTPESAGDYASGTNHTLPTYGWAHSMSGVNLDSFMRKMTFQEITPEGLKNIGPTVETMAAAEGLDAHKNAVSIRLRDF